MTQGSFWAVVSRLLPDLFPDSCPACSRLLLPCFPTRADMFPTLVPRLFPHPALPVPGNVCEFWSFDALVNTSRSFGAALAVTRRLLCYLLGMRSIPKGLSSPDSLLPEVDGVPSLRMWLSCLSAIPRAQRFRKLLRTAPSCYRAAFRQEPGRTDTPAEVIAALSSSGQVRVSDLLGGNWAVRDKGQGDREALTGFLRLKPDACAKLEKLSGQLGVFVTRLRKPQERGRKPIWIRRLDKEGRDKYFRRVATLQKDRGQPILYRAGGEW